MAWREHFKTDGALPVIGFVQGVILYILSEHGGGLAEVMKDALILTSLTAPVFLMLTWEKKRLRQVLITTALFAAATWGVTYIFGLRIGPFRDTFPASGGLGVTAWLATLALVLWVGEPAGDAATRYARRFNRLTESLVSVAEAGLFIGILWVILFIWGTLFNLIGIDFFSRLFGKAYFGWAFSGAAFGLGLMLLRILPGVVIALRRLVLASLRVFAVALTVMGVLFLLALGWKGLDALIRTGADAEILIWAMLLSIFFINGVVADSSAETAAPQWQKNLVRGLLIVLPIYAGLGLYTLWLRYHGEGLTVDRVYGFALAGVGMVMSVAYAFSALRLGSGWTMGVARANPLLWRFALVVAVLMHIPPLTAHNIAAANQKARLLAGAPADLKALGALKYNYGKPGETAFQTLAGNAGFAARPDAEKALESLRGIADRNAWLAKSNEIAVGPKGDDVLTLSDLDVYPETAVIPEGIIDATVKGSPGTADMCGRQWVNKERCVAIIIDMTGDGVDDVALWNAYAGVVVLSKVGEAWQVVRTLAANQAVDPNTLRPALKGGAVTAVPPAANDLKIGDMRFE